MISLADISLHLHNVGSAPARNVEVVVGDTIVARRGVLGVGSAYWAVTADEIKQLPANQMGPWKTSFESAASAEPPFFTIRFEDLAGALYEVKHQLRRTGDRPPDLRPYGAMTLDRVR